ncbi:MAG: glucose-1-phosphate cytidylyltransferase [Phycisphaerae bacterium]|jgi:glucose-1-phosphate cytidylyltransferase|nr:MAG: glucose-1-phosphate cytidylyltransferase [Phycisphaerae bacterium]
MKVVIFCGGQGLRLRDYSENTPKPMVPVGYRPIIWHLMKYYAHYGHKEFILCLGYRADVIKDYFLRYNECTTNDFVLTKGGRDLQLLSSDISDWKITFVDTGMDANVGQRLCAVRKHLDNDPVFLANYADCLTDAPLPEMIEQFEKTDAVASFLSVIPPYTFHSVRQNEAGEVVDLVDVVHMDLWINGGYQIYRREIFDYFQPGDDMIPTVYRRLAAAKKLITYRHHGFWACMDTFKEKMVLDDLEAKGQAPWKVWRRSASTIANVKRTA